MSTPLKLAVVTGGHNFDIPAFQHVFRTMTNVDFYVQSLDEFTYSPQAAAQCDVVLSYIMYRFQPGQGPLWTQKNVFSTRETLGTTPQGSVVLHHALLAFPDWMSRRHTRTGSPPLARLARRRVGKTTGKRPAPA